MDEQSVTAWLESEGYELRARKEGIPVYMANANLCVSFEHVLFGWAHYSRYDKGTPRYELVLHPQLLGERTIHADLPSATTRFAEVKRRGLASGKGTVYSEPKLRRAKHAA